MSTATLDVIEFQATLPVLLERASRSLLDAKSSGEVLEARDMARVAYDAAKSAGRYAKAQKAHDDIIVAVQRAKADALEIEARAIRRLADEYDAAQERGEVASVGKPVIIPNGNNKAKAVEIGVDPKQMHEARKLRDAEKASPGKTKRVLKEMVDRGEDPTPAKLRKEMTPKPAPVEKVAAPAIEPERRKLAKLPVESLIDDVLGLRADLADAKKKIKEQAAEIRGLKEQVKDFSGDQAETIRRQATALAHKDSEMYRANDTADRAMARAHKAEKRVTELEKMGIAL